jgi:hypothetical protein
VVRFAVGEEEGDDGGGGGEVEEDVGCEGGEIEAFGELVLVLVLVLVEDNGSEGGVLLVKSTKRLPERSSGPDFSLPLLASGSSIAPGRGRPNRLGAGCKSGGRFCASL